MPRIALCVRYDGSAYHGWQSQRSGLATVQAALESALTKLANHPITVCCAGRTDAGVHATAQIVHFDSDAQRSEKAWVFGTNTYLPSDVSVLWAKVVSSDFHARFAATARSYQYLIHNEPVRPALLRHALAHYHRPLDAQKMQEAGQFLLGEQDFSAFRGSGCQSRTPMRCVHYLIVSRQRDQVWVDIKANAFLLHMVRNILGVLVAIGCGDRPPVWALEVLQSRDRCCAGVTMAASGLYLVGVDYPASFGLPKTESKILLSV